MVDKGIFLEDETMAVLTAGEYPCRNPGQNIADLKAQVAAKRKASVLCGVAATAVIEAWALGFAAVTPASAAAALSLSSLHFYLMEVDYKGALAVRPFGFLAFAAPAAAVLALGRHMLAA